MMKLQRRDAGSSTTTTSMSIPMPISMQSQTVLRGNGAASARAVYVFASTLLLIVQLTQGSEKGNPNAFTPSAPYIANGCRVETYSSASLKHEVPIYLRFPPEECATAISGKVGVAIQLSAHAGIS